MVEKTERALFDASNIVIGLRQAGVDWPKEVSQENFFAVICSVWTSEPADFAQPKYNTKGTRIFQQFADAADCFHKSGYIDFVDSVGREIEVELFQYNRGNGRVIHSKILFS